MDSTRPAQPRIRPTERREIPRGPTVEFPEDRGIPRVETFDVKTVLAEALKKGLGDQLIRAPNGVPEEQFKRSVQNFKFLKRIQDDQFGDVREIPAEQAHEVAQAVYELRGILPKLTGPSDDDFDIIDEKNVPKLAAPTAEAGLLSRSISAVSQTLGGMARAVKNLTSGQT